MGLAVSIFSEVGTGLQPILLNLLKFGFAVLLIVYLVTSGKLDFGDLRLYLDSPLILVFAILQWGFLFVLVGGLRWYLLLIGLRLPVAFSHVVRLQMIGLFFNVAMPGAVGGDLIKAVYVVRGSKLAGKTSAMLSVLVDRVTGLIGLFLIAAMVIGTNFAFVWENQALRPIVFVVYASVVVTIGGFVLVLLPHEDKDRVGGFLSKPIIGFSFLKKIYVAMRCYRDRPSILVFAVGLSVINQAFFMWFFWIVAAALNGATPPLGPFATVFPIGAFVTSLPIAPAGLGVGHIAFQNLMALIGVAEGANIFNVVTLGMIALNLIGVIPYLLHRGEIKIGNLPSAEALAPE